MHNVIVIAESEANQLNTASLECLAEVREIADSLGAVVHAILPGADVAPLADTLAAHGADTVTLVEHPALRHFSADGWLAALAQMDLTPQPPSLRGKGENTPRASGSPPFAGEGVGERSAASDHPSLVRGGVGGGVWLLVAPDTPHTRAWLPRLALRQGWPVASGCVQVRATHDGLWVTRATYGGQRHEETTYPPGTPLVALLTPGARGIGTPQPGRKAHVTHLTPDLDPTAWRDQTLRRVPPDPATVDISEAERIVAGGLGLGSADGVRLVQALAERLHAAVGGTRVIVDRGWLPFERQIGTTGKTVAPRLYIALGISGASQHTAGITGSETIITVNTDRTAPMFGLSDLGIVGDVHQVVPELLRQLDATQDTNVESSGSYDRAF